MTESKQDQALVLRPGDVVAVTGAGGAWEQPR
jgi:hypothetical protein